MKFHTKTVVLLYLGCVVYSDHHEQCSVKSLRSVPVNLKLLNSNFWQREWTGCFSGLGLCNNIPVF